MHHPTDRIVDNLAFGIAVVEHRLEREIVIKIVVLNNNKFYNPQKSKQPNNKHKKTYQKNPNIIQTNKKTNKKKNN